LLIYTEECVDRKEARRREKYWKRRKWQKKIEIAKVKIHVSGSTCLPRNVGRFPP
jgi:predicted GIY-YIG superfamily endonuclease